MANCHRVQQWRLRSEKYGSLPSLWNDSPGRSSLSSLPPIIRSIILLLISEVPFLLFLVAYGTNEFLRILPTFDDAVDCHVFLHDVIAWERLALSPLLTPPLGKPLNLIVSSANCTALDILAAVPYLVHYTLPVVCPFVLIVVFRRADRACRFNALLGVTMWMFYIIWYFLPTAPPWYRIDLALTEISNGGYEGQTEVSSSLVSGGDLLSTTVQSPASLTASRRQNLIREGAAFARLDRLFDVTVFQSLFAGNPVPFGAFPSGHVAWPTCFVISVPATRIGWYRRLIFGGGYVSLVAWATIYSSHHYVADVVVAVFIVIIFNWLLDCFHLVTDRTSAVETFRCHSDDDVSPIDDVSVDAVSKYNVNSLEKYLGRRCNRLHCVNSCCAVSYLQTSKNERFL